MVMKHPIVGRPGLGVLSHQVDPGRADACPLLHHLDGSMGSPMPDLWAATADQSKGNQPTAPPNLGALSTGAAATQCITSTALVLAAGGQLARTADWLSGL